MRSIASLVLVLSFSAGAARAGEVMEMIVCKVNGDIVTRSELGKLRLQVAAELAARGIKGAEAQKIIAEQEQNLLRDKIDELLLIQKAKEANVNVDTEVVKQLGELQKRSGIADPEKFATWVKEQTGMSLEDYRSNVKNGMMTQRIIGDEVHRKINLPRPEIQKYYEEHKTEFVREERVFLRELLMSSEGKTTAELAKVEAKAKDISARAKKGEKFLDLIRDNSDAATKEQAGDIGGFKQGELDKAIEALVWDKPKNFITDPIKRPNGWLLLRVEDHPRAGQATFEEAEAEIRDRLYGPLFQPKMREFLTRLRVDAFLEIREGFVDAGAAPGKDTKWQDPAVLKPATVTKEEVAEQSKHKRLLWVIPIPGSKTTAKGKSSSR